MREAGWRYISALTDPQIRRRLQQGTLQPGLFHEAVCEVQADGVRYLLRKNQAEAARERRRLEDELAKLAHKVEQRNAQVELRLEGRRVALERTRAAIDRAMESAGCYMVVTDVPPANMSGQAAHDSYVHLQRAERDFRALKIVREMERRRDYIGNRIFGSQDAVVNLVWACPRSACGRAARR